MSQDKRQALDDMFAGVFREQALDSMLAGALREPSAISTKTESSPTTFSDSPANEEPADQAPVDVPPDAGNPSIWAEQAKSLLAVLDLDTAIRLRWVLRDIKAERMKLTPVSPSDLGTLIEVGLVEMRDEAFMLTNEGHRELD
jgi:hypothetical protein